jgi:glycosyltransferase involved in cell wall biosynthesis
MNPFVNIVLSTYNGASYLEQLLLSLKNQKGVNIRLIFRDDGSSDSSRDIVIKYFPDAIECTDFNFNMGVAKSYFHLLDHVPDNGLIAFCDQDDIWESDKCMIAENKIRSHKKDLYASRVKIIGSDYIYPKKIPQLKLINAIFENTTIGSTIVFTQKLLGQVISLDIPDHILHDEVFNLVACSNNSIVFDEIPRINYRIHAGNDTGIGVLQDGFRMKYIERFVRLWGINEKVVIKCDILNQLIDSDICSTELIETLRILETEKKKRLHLKLRGLYFRNSKYESFLLKQMWRFGLI